MRHPSRAPRAKLPASKSVPTPDPRPRPTWVFVEPGPLPPMLTAEQIAVLNARDAARRRPRGPRRPEECTVSYSYYPTGKHSVAMLRLRGKWLEAMGFHPGTRLSVGVREDGALILQPLPSAEPAPAPKRRR